MWEGESVCGRESVGESVCERVCVWERECVCGEGESVLEGESVWGGSVWEGEIVRV